MKGTSVLTSGFHTVDPGGICFGLVHFKFSPSLAYGVPQGSVLGALLFLFHLLALLHILSTSFNATMQMGLSLTFL